MDCQSINQMYYNHKLHQCLLENFRELFQELRDFKDLIYLLDLNQEKFTTYLPR
jgi:hypothetical protein